MPRVCTGIICLLMASAASAAGVEKNPPLSGDTLQLAVVSEAIVVARAGAGMAIVEGEGRSVALWIEHTVKGPLRGSRDIVWVHGKELPAQMESGGKAWLLFLKPGVDGYWHVQNGGAAVLGADDPAVAAVANFLGVRGAPPEPEPPSNDEMGLWIKKAAKGSKEARRQAFESLLAAGDSARPQLLSALGDAEREVAAVARTLLALCGGGPAVNNLRLVLEPAKLELSPGGKRMLSVNFANLAAQEMKVVTGRTNWGDNVQAAAAFDVRPQPAAAGKSSPALPTTLPLAYGKPGLQESPPAPLVRTISAHGALPVAVEVRLETISLDGKNLLRLFFPHGHVDLPGPGAYAVRVYFDCPGPRPEQTRLLENYWKGGQLVSNAITLTVKLAE